MTAHPHVDSTTGRLLSFSYQVTHSFTKPMGTTLTFWEYTPGKELYSRCHALLTC